MKIMLTGTDKRTQIIGNLLSEKIKDLFLYEYNGKIDDDTNIIILPTPVTSDDINLNFTNSPDKRISTLLDNAPEKSLIICAGFKNNRVYDLCNRDDFSIKNAIPTAEGAVSLVINNTDTTIYGSKILITGFGRVSRIQLYRLFHFKADITVAVRKTGNMAEIEALGMKSIYIDSIKSYIDNFDIVLNTVPFMLFDSSTLSNSKSTTLFIELASHQAGFDVNFINTNGINYINAPGLPGKIAPVSAGKIMAETILNVLKEKNMY